MKLAAAIAALCFLSSRQVMLRRVRPFLSRGDFDGALAEIETRPRSAWAKDGPVFLLAAEVHAGRGDFQSALSFMEDAIDAAALAEDLAAAARALFLELQIREAMMDFQGALRALERASSMRDGFDSRTEFRLLLSKVRLLRVHGGDPNEVETARAEALAVFHREDLRFLAGAPALLREAVAEFGADDRKLFTKALQVLGLEIPDRACAQLQGDFGAVERSVRRTANIASKKKK